MHIPVLPKETLELLNPQIGQTIVDATFGEGGHAAKILRKIGPPKDGGRLIGIDRDPSAIDKATHKFADDVKIGRLLLVQGRFSELASILQHLGHPEVDGVLMDFGVSTEQILSKERGFSFAGDTESPLDMRMDPREDLTAERILAEWSEHELRDLFFMVGERQYAKRLAQKIVKTRAETPFKNSQQLKELVDSAIPPGKKRGTVNVATRVFMALRMAVNHELEEITAGLEAAMKSLRPGGRLAAISFHSLEDKIVKQTFRKWAAPCVCPPELAICVCKREPIIKILTNKPVQAGKKELASNPRSRSAKLRACQKL